MNKTDKYLLWENLIGEWKNSGLTKRQWCKENNLKEHQFYYWMNRINDKSHQSNNLNGTSTNWQSIELIDRPLDECNHSLIVRVGDFDVEVHPDTDLHLFTNIIRVLRTC